MEKRPAPDERNILPSRVREGPGVGARYRLGRPTVEVRELRNNATPHEEMLWRQLKGKRLAGLKFSRQMPVAGYRVDFVCRAKKLIVELDGSQHSEAVAYDDARTRKLERAGYRVIRFWNNDLTSNMDGVLETIAAAAFVTERAPTPYPLPLAGGEVAGLASPDSAGQDA
jgi:crossover junction endodeoxyribonuclease RuvC